MLCSHLGGTLYSHSVSLHPGVLMGTNERDTGELSACDGLASHAGEVEILDSFQAKRTGVKRRPDGRLDSYADLFMQNLLVIFTLIECSRNVNLS